MFTREWKSGEQVIHSGRPEWGVGQITRAEVQATNGARSQTLTIRFDRAGLKTLSTAYADLRPASSDSPASTGPIAPETLVPDDEPDAAERLASLPDEATDPFLPIDARLRATFVLYRFNPSGGSLLDWAIAQSGLRDPLSRFSRHELEQSFERFRIALDQHLKNLLVSMKRQDPTGLQAVLAAAPPGAQQALRRIDALR